MDSSCRMPRNMREQAGQVDYWDRSCVVRLLSVSTLRFPKLGNGAKSMRHMGQHQGTSRYPHISRTPCPSPGLVRAATGYWALSERAGMAPGSYEAIQGHPREGLCRLAALAQAAPPGRVAPLTPSASGITQRLLGASTGRREMAQ